MLVRLGKAVGPALGALGDIHKDDVGPALAKLTESLSEDDLVAICDPLAQNTFVRTGPSQTPILAKIFDDHFAGKYDLMAKWLVFALEVNFGSFFDGLRKKVPQAASAPAAPDATQTT
jgi:hypothetical protein